MINQTNKQKCAISLSGVSKKYRLGILDGSNLLKRFFSKNKSQFFWALKNVNLSIPSGKIIGVVGPNGAGKSTLLKIISKITTPTAGEIQVVGKVASLLEAGVGFHPEYTGKENILLQGAYLGMNPREIKKRIDEILIYAGVEKYADTPLKRYSSGMTLRLGTATALCLDAEILLLDEILSVADSSFRAKYKDSLRNSNRTEERTILFVSHNHDLLQQTCDAGILVFKGETFYFDSFEETLLAYEAKNEDSAQNHACFPITFKSEEMNLVITDAFWHEGESFSPFSITVTYRVLKSSDDISVGLSIRPKNDARLNLCLDPVSGGEKLPNETGDFETCFNYPYFPGNPGQYFLSIAIWHKGHCIGVEKDVALFSVKGARQSLGGNRTKFQVLPTEAITN